MNLLRRRIDDIIAFEIKKLIDMSKEVKVSYDTRNVRTPKTTIEFINDCKVVIPSGYGGYVIASGCGSGKTTAIVDMIIKMKNYGVLYSASTIEECNKMYKTLINKGVDEQDMLVLHSDYTFVGVDNNAYRRNDDRIRDKKILICTHHKLLHEHNDMLYSFRSYPIDPSVMFRDGQSITRSHAAVSATINIRQNIFIDEVPTCESLEVEITSMNLNQLAIPELEDKVIKNAKLYDYRTREWFIEDKELRSVKLDESGNVIRIVLPYDGGFRRAISEMSKFTKGMYPEDCEANTLKNDIISDMVYENMESMLNSKNDRFILVRTLSNLLYKDITMRVMLFEGTGDLTFYDSTLFDVLKVESTLQSPPNHYVSDVGRYSSPIVVREPIPFNIERRYKNTKEFNNSKANIDSEWVNVLNELDKIVNNPVEQFETTNIPITGTLIQTWKNYSIKSKDSVDYIDSDADDTIPNMIKEELNKRGVTGKFEVIHFMSGLDKATNEFRDFNRIVILGNIQVPRDAINKFNSDYKVNTTPELFRTYQLAQLVCRTEIRKHEGKPIFIYYTSDIPTIIIERVVRYLSNEKVENIAKITQVSKAYNLDDLGIKPKWRPIIEMFCDLDPEFKDSILNRSPYTLNIKLDDIYQLVPMSEKRISKYNPLINYLRKFNINLSIESQKTK